MIIRRANLVATLAAVAVIAISALYTIGYTYSVNDDRLQYFYGMYGKSFDRTLEKQYTTQNEEALKQIETIGYDEIAMYRFRIRLWVNDNFPLVSALYYQVRRGLFSPAPMAEGEFPAFLARAMLFCFAAGIGAATLIVAYVLLVHASSRIAIATAIALAIMFALKAIPTGGLTQHEGLFQGSDAGLPLRILLMIVKPDPLMDFASYLQKGQLFLFVFGIFALRWSGKLSGSYCLLFVAGLFHQAMSWVVFGPILFIDLLLRPKRLLEPWTLVGLALIGAHAVFDPRRLAVLWQFASPLALMAAGGVLVIVGGAFFVWWIRSTRGQRLREKMLARGDIVADLVALTFIWLAILAASYAVTIAIGRLDWLFWGVVAGRALAVFRVALFVGLVYLLLERFVFGQAGRERVVFAGAIVAMVAIGVIQLYRAPAVTQALDRAIQQTRVIENQLTTRPSGRYGFKDEAVLVYAMIKSIETGRQLVPAHFR